MALRSLGEGVRLSVDQLRANKFRSFLTILGVVIGVAVVILMSAMIGGVRSGVLEGIEAAGPKNFILARWNFNAVIIHDGSGPPWGNNPPIQVEEARRLEELRQIRRAIVDVDMHVTAEHSGRRLSNIQVAGRSEGWEDFAPGDYVSGRGFLEADVRASRRVAVISKPLADELFGRRDPIGQTVRLRGVPFEVLGVYEVKGNIFVELIKHWVIVPYSSGLKYLNAPRNFVKVLMVPEDAFTQDEAMDQVTATLRVMRGLRPGEPNDFAIIRQEEMVEQFNRITGVFFLVMLGLSSVALLVGGIGVVAIMLISVTERTREIGVRKALGATRGEILFQFLIEAATLTVIGAALGLLIGGGLAFMVSALTPITSQLPAAAIGAALAMAAIAGIFFGLWPAWRAARMDPVEALRYE